MWPPASLPPTGGSRSKNEKEGTPLKIVVYAICKDEAQFVDRWMDSMSEADQVVVLDTGSTDGTAEKLRARGAAVTVETVVPWRFDAARNRSLDLVPEDADVCVCTDLDEVFRPGCGPPWSGPGPREWAGPPTGTPGPSTPTGRRGWCSGPTRSTPAAAGGGSTRSTRCSGGRGTGWAAPGDGGGGPAGPPPRPPQVPGPVSAPAGAVGAEEPEDDRNVHYLGREYLFHRRWDDCIRTLKRHLAMPTATWKDERAASMRYIAKAYYNKGETAQARDWFLRAITEAPWLREPLHRPGPDALRAGGVGGGALLHRLRPGRHRPAPQLYQRGGRLGPPAPRPARHRPLPHRGTTPRPWRRGKRPWPSPPGTRGCGRMCGSWRRRRG